MQRIHIVDVQADIIYKIEIIYDNYILSIIHLKWNLMITRPCVHVYLIKNALFFCCH